MFEFIEKTPFSLQRSVIHSCMSVRSPQREKVNIFKEYGNLFRTNRTVRCYYFFAIWGFKHRLRVLTAQKIKTYTKKILYHVAVSKAEIG